MEFPLWHLPMDEQLNKESEGIAMILPTAAALLQDTALKPLFEDFPGHQGNNPSEEEQNIHFLSSSTLSHFPQELTHRPHKKTNRELGSVYMGQPDPVAVGSPSSPHVQQDLDSCFERELISQEARDSLLSARKSLFGEKEVISVAVTPIRLDSVSTSSENLNFTKALVDEQEYGNKPPLLTTFECNSFVRFPREIEEHIQWNYFLKELCQYKKIHGHVNVPHKYKKNPSLARWVKQQRQQYRLQKEGQMIASLSADRVQVLESIGFRWDIYGEIWKERISELKAYKAKYNSCEVPCRFPENPQLAIWVKHQRRQYRLYKEGRPTSMTDYRIRELEALGFVWVLRNYKNRGPKHPSP